MELSPRSRAYLLLGIILIFCAAIILWVFVINRGTLLINGPVPYDLNIVGAPSAHCQENPCSLRLFPNTYQITFKKTGYYDQIQTLEVRRFQETAFNLQFKLIPAIKPFTTYQPITFPGRPFQFSTNSGSLTLAKSFQSNFGKIPFQIQNIVISKSFKQALIETSSNLYLSDLKNGIVTKLPLPNVLNPIWLPDESGFVYLKKEPQERYQGLYLYSFQDAKPEIIAYFNKEITDSVIAVAHNQREIAIADIADSALYLINRPQKVRRGLDVKLKISSIIWSQNDQWLLLQGTAKQNYPLYFFNIESRKLIETNINVPPHLVAFRNSESVILVLPDSSGLTLGSSDDIQTIIRLERQAQAGLSFFEYQIPNRTLETITNSTSDFIINPERIEVGESGKNIFFLQEGKVFEIKLE